MTSFENLTKSQKTRASLHRDVLSICREACHLLGLEITKPAMEIISELVYKKISIYGLDLEAFSKHARRSTINSDDVKLLVRRNPSLKTHLTAILTNQPSTLKEKRRKTNAPTSVIEDLVPTKSKPESTTEKECTEKDMLQNDFEIDDRIENMDLHDTIDLTFD